MVEALTRTNGLVHPENTSRTSLALLLRSSSTMHPFTREKRLTWQLFPVQFCSFTCSPRGSMFDENRNTHTYTQHTHAVSLSHTHTLSLSLTQEETKEQKKEKKEKTEAERTVDDVEPENKETFDPDETYHKGQFALR